MPRPGAEALAKRVSRALPKPRRAQVVSRGGSFSVLPSRSGDAVDPEVLLTELTRAVLNRARTVSPRLTHVEPTLTTPAAEAAVAEAQTLVEQPVTLTFKGEDVGSLTPERLAKLVRFRVGVESFRVGFDSRRVAKAVEPMVAQWRQRAVNARFIVDGNARPDPPLTARSCRRRQVGGRLGRDSRLGIDQPRLPAPEADPRRPHHE